jgi:hypothetical protein
MTRPPIRICIAALIVFHAGPSPARAVEIRIKPGRGVISQAVQQAKEQRCAVA